MILLPKVGSKEDLDFANKISSKIDNILEISLDPYEDERICKVKYEELHIFYISKEGSDTYEEVNSDSNRSNKDNKGNGYDESNRYDEGNRCDKGERLHQRSR